MARLAVTSCQSARIATPSNSAGAAARSQPRATPGSAPNLIWRLARAVSSPRSSGWIALSGGDVAGGLARFESHMPPPADCSRPFSTAGGVSCTQKRRPQPRVSTFRAAHRRRTPPTHQRAETTTLRPSSIRTVPSAPASHRICFAEKRRRSRAWRVTRHTAGRESHPALKVALLDYERETRQARLSRRAGCSRITIECTLPWPDLPRGSISGPHAWRGTRRTGMRRAVFRRCRCRYDGRRPRSASGHSDQSAEARRSSSAAR